MAILPALDEEATVRAVVLGLLDKVDRVIVVDNGSTDETAARARDAGADVVREPERGYGRACLAGVRRARQLGARVLVFLDADGSEDPDDVPRVVAPVTRGDSDLALGARASEWIEPGSMTVPQRFGNWLAPLLMRWTTGADYHDMPPLKAMTLEAFDGLGVRDTGHGFTIELLLKAHAAKLRIEELPVRCRRRAGGKSKVSGTLSGTARASAKILSYVLRYAWDTKRSRHTAKILAVSLALWMVCWPRTAQAYPWMMRHGYFGCSTCHADPSGGSLLTQYGRAQGDLLLRMRYGSSATTSDTATNDDFDGFDEFDGDSAPKPRATEPEDASEESDLTTPLWGVLEPPEWLLVGGSYRHMTLYKIAEEGNELRTFPMQIDVYGQLQFDWFSAFGSIGLAKVRAGSPFARRAQVTTNQGDQLNLISRAHWVAARFTRIQVRAGRLDIPFGVRIPEHTMWVRNATRTDRESAQQHGLALAYESELLRGELMTILGNYQIRPDALRERGYSAYAELRAAEPIYLGASSLVAHASADYETLEEDVTRQAHGVFARVRVAAPVVVLAEGDALIRSRRDLGYVGFIQTDLEVIQGLHFAVTGEVLDRGYRDTGDPFDTIRKERGFGRPAFGGWLTVDWFFLPQLEARFDAVARQTEDLTFLAQLHVYL